MCHQMTAVGFPKIETNVPDFCKLLNNKNHNDALKILYYTDFFGYISSLIFSDTPTCWLNKLHNEHTVLISAGLNPGQMLYQCNAAFHH